jgi:hypothetical protein
MIKKKGDKFVVLSEGGRVLGEHNTRREAVEQLRAIEASKTNPSQAASSIKDAFGTPEEESADEEKSDFMDVVGSWWKRVLGDSTARERLGERVGKFRRGEGR